MTWDHHLRSFARRVRQHMAAPSHCIEEFNELAIELFQLQIDHNGAYRKFCQSRGLRGTDVRDWTAVPAVPTSAFKELDLTCIPPNERMAVFHSSGTTEHRPSQHFHNRASLDVYETSLTAWFARHFKTDAQRKRTVSLTPSHDQAPHSSLVHMFETLRTGLHLDPFVFTGAALHDGSWQLDSARTLEKLRESEATNTPTLLLGTAFSYVHLLDYLVAHRLKVQLPPGSFVLETGGYKGRSRILPKPELHSLISTRLGVPDSHIICEYGMSELGSQAYDRAATSNPGAHRIFRFPHWVRTRIISPETGLDVAEGETGLLRIFDLANVYSVMAIQTEDLAVRRADGFDLIGRAALAEPRGCSLMAG